MTESGVAVRRPLSPRKFFAMLYETDAAAAAAEHARRPLNGRAGDVPLQQWYGLRRPSVPVQLTAAADPSLQQHTVVVVRPTAAYVEHTFAAGLTAFREYIICPLDDGIRCRYTVLYILWQNNILNYIFKVVFIIFVVIYSFE
jgi:hypothetical protein